MAEKRTITPEQRLQAIGLLTLVRSYARKLQECEAALAETLGVPSDDGYFGHVSDAIWEDYDCDTLLAKMEITVEDPADKGDA